MKSNFFRGLFKFAPEGAAGTGGTDDTGQTGGGKSTGGTGGSSGTTGSGSDQGENHPIDYDRIQQMLDGTLQAKEKTALKKYFEQQGLTPEQAQQAIDDFKSHQAANTPDVVAMQAQLAESQKTAMQAQVNAAATMAAVSLGVDAKNIPYILKLADLGQVVGQDGKINNDALTQALNKVLEDIPQLKPQEPGNTGFVQVGTGGNPGMHSQQTTVNQAVPSKRWNRWNY